MKTIRIKRVEHRSLASALAIIFAVLVVGVTICLSRKGEAAPAPSTSVTAATVQRWKVTNGYYALNIFGDGTLLAARDDIVNGQGFGLKINPHNGATIASMTVPDVRTSIRLSTGDQDYVVGGYENRSEIREDGSFVRSLIPLGCCNIPRHPLALDPTNDQAYAQANGAMFITNMSTGDWHYLYTTIDSFGMVTIAESDTLYTSGQNGTVVRFNPTTGLQWSVGLTANIPLQPGAVSNDGSYLVSTGSGHFQGSPQPGRLVRIAADGTIAWDNSINAVTPPVIGSNGLAFIGTQAAPVNENGAGAIEAYDVATGALVWRTPVEGLPNDLLIGDDGAVYAGTGSFTNGQLYSLSQVDGAIRQTITDIDGAWEIVLRGGLIFASGHSITALPVAATNYDANSPWPVRFHDNQRSGNRHFPLLTAPRDLPPIECSGVQWFQWRAADGGNDHFYANAGPILNWHDARNAAEAQGATLVTITSQAERDFVVSTLMSGQNVYWLGATDETSEGTFTWVTGEPFVYTDWVPGEPNNYSGSENYLAANWHVARDGLNAGQGVGNFGKWNDVYLNGSDAATGPVGPYQALFERNTAPTFCPSSVRIDPGAFAGDYFFNDGSGHWVNYRGAQTLNLVAGHYGIEIGALGYVAEEFTFDVDDNGNVAGVSNSTAAYGNGNTLFLNNCTVNFNPQNYAGDYFVEGRNEISNQGQKSFVLVPGVAQYVSIYGRGIDTDIFFNIGSSGQLSNVSKPTAAFAIGNTLYLSNVEVRCDPTNYGGTFRLGSQYSNGVTNMVAVPGVLLYVNVSDHVAAVTPTIDRVTPPLVTLNVGADQYTFLFTLPSIDREAPVITIAAPTAGTYLLNQAVTVSFNCYDGGAGVASCTGTTANGSLLNTFNAGEHTFTVEAVDNVGNRANPSQVIYTVSFGVMALFDQTKAAKSGSSIPIKIRLVDANGANVSSAAIAVHAVSVVQLSNQSSSALQDAGNANPDFDFRYDAGLGGYIFNLKTAGLVTGSYLLRFSAGGNSTSYSVGFQIRQ